MSSPPPAAPRGDPGRPRTLAANIASNFAGQGWSLACSLIAVPVYIDRLGLEAFGLLGFYLAAQGVLRLLDLGLTPAVNRQVARLGARPQSAPELGDFVWTLEVVFLAAGAAVALLLLPAAPAVARGWLQVEALDPDAVEESVAWMFLLTALQWPVSFWHAVLMGLERQGTYNALRALAATLQHGGGVAVVLLPSPAITTLFRWQLAVTALFAVLLRAAARRRLPRRGGRARFRLPLALELRRFAAGMAAISATALVISHMDRIALSRLAPLSDLGCYSLAVLVASGLVMLIITPVFHAIFPRFSALAAAGRTEELERFYHLSHQVMAAALLPAALFLSWFARPVLELWTGDPQTAARAAPILSVYVLGTLGNGLMNPPYALQLAADRERLALASNAVMIALFVPAALVLVPRYGGPGCAGIWAGLMALYLAGGLPLTHRLVLAGGGLRSVLGDLAPALAAALAVLAPAAWIAGRIERPAGQVAVAAFGGLAAAGLSVLLLGRLRAAVLGALGSLRPRLHAPPGGPPEKRIPADATTRGLP